MSEKLKDQEQEEREDCVVVHVTEDGGPLTVTHKMGLAAASEFYDRITSRYIGQGGAYLCRVLHDADSQFPVARLSRQGAEGRETWLTIPEIEDCALACETFANGVGVSKAGDAWMDLADKCSRLAALRAEPQDETDVWVAGPWDRICMKCSRPLSDTRPCPASSTTAAAHTSLRAPTGHTGEGT